MKPFSEIQRRLKQLQDRYGWMKRWAITLDRDGDWTPMTVVEGDYKLCMDGGILCEDDRFALGAIMAGLHHQRIQAERAPEAN